MRKTTGERLLAAAAGIAGLVAVFFLGKWISAQMYHRPDTSTEVRSEEIMDSPQEALTEEELEALFRAIKEPAVYSGQAGDSFGTLSGEISAEASGQQPEDEIDFPFLWTVNEDIIAWITIPETNIDYPILQHPSDDSYYLHHNIDGSYGYPGCIYTEGLNSDDFTDPNTLVYGHNLKAKTMFTELHRFENRDFFEENSEVIIYLPDRTLHYRIFAAYVYDDRHLLYSFDFEDEEVYADYLQSVFDIRDINANIDRECRVTSQDRIITLVTCMPNKADAEKRLLVQAVLLEDTQE